MLHEDLMYVGWYIRSFAGIHCASSGDLTVTVLFFLLILQSFVKHQKKGL